MAAEVIDLTLSDGEDGQTVYGAKNDRKQINDADINGQIQSEEGLFFIDKPTLSSFAPTNSFNTEGDGSNSQSSSLLLPLHVSLFGDESHNVQFLPPPEPNSDEENYIEYLEYDGRDMPPVRYFEELNNTNESAPTKLVCKKCGAENQHKTNECPVIICLTCGARDEHPTRSCPISKTCFSCGMKGHINANCPNRYSRNIESNIYNECDRCGSDLHKANECPTLWRMYQYLSVEERDTTVATRNSKQDLPMGNGGEGFISSDEWCYCCGDSGHWGDDCSEMPMHDRPKEFSAFSNYNMSSGPFFDPEAGLSEPKPSRRRPRNRSRDREYDLNALPENWHAGLPDHVGRKGRTKTRERMEERAVKTRELEDDDEDDWFGRQKSNGRTESKEKGRSQGPAKKMAINFKNGSSSSKPTLFDRIGGPILNGSSSRKDKHGGRRDWDDDERDHRNGRDKDYNRASRDDRRPYSEEKYSARSSYDARRTADRRDDDYRRKINSRDNAPRYTGGYGRR